MYKMNGIVIASTTPGHFYLLSEGDKMISALRTWLAMAMILMANSAHAETNKTFTFENQKEEVFDLENWLKETRYTTEVIDSTCYRQEPYVENVCRQVTRYRQECHTVPGREYCRTIYEQVCRTENRYENECHTVPGAEQCRVVVRYRQECSTSGGGRQCRTVPGDVECRIVNGENRCTKIPPREVCEDRPGQQQCRQVPYEERECSSGPSRQECRQVNRPHQVCDSRPRQQCDWEPAHQACNQVPYSATECKDETLYRQIPYACKETVQVPHSVTLKTHQSNVQVLFDLKAQEAAGEFNVALTERGDLVLKGAEQADKKTIALLKKDVKTTSNGDINTIDGIFKIALFDKADFFQAKNISNVELKKRSLSFVVNGKFDMKRTSLAVKISKKDEVKFEKTLKSTQFSSKYEGGVTRVEINLESLGAPKLGGFFNKKHTVALKLKLDLSDMGELVFPKTNELSLETATEVEVE